MPLVGETEVAVEAGRGGVANNPVEEMGKPAFGLVLQPQVSVSVSEPPGLGESVPGDADQRPTDWPCGGDVGIRRHRRGGGVRDRSAELHFIGYTTDTGRSRDHRSGRT
ncbi:hypothetical protein GCM10009634_74190 [Saccharothrix xinjiangensis]